MNNVSIVICSCLNKPARVEYLDKCVENINQVFGPDMDILIAFDKYGKEIDGARCYTHDHGMGHGWNWGIKNAKNDLILQIEDDWIVEIGGNNEKEIPTLERFYYHLGNRIKVVNQFGGIFKFTFINDEYYPSGKTPQEYEGYNFLEYNRPQSYVNNTWDMYYYANQPHLKKKKLHDKVGYYLEDAPPEKVEIDMCKKYYDSGERVFACPFFTFIHIGFQSARKNEIYTTYNHSGNTK